MSVILTAANPQIGPTPLTPGVEDLPDRFVAHNLHGVVHWAKEVNEAMRAGYASVAYHDAKGVGAPIPVCVAVGGWTLPEPCCAGHQAPDPTEVGVMASPEVASTWWRCGGCGDLVEPTIWATIPLRPEVHRDGPLSWLLPSPGAAAKAADRGWDLWVAELRSCGDSDARIEADLLRQLMLASQGADMDQARKRASTPTDLFSGPSGRPETAASARWGDGEDGVGHIELGFHEPVPITAVDIEQQGRFEVQFAKTTTVAITAATATRLWPDDVETPPEGELTAARIRDTWARLGVAELPRWMDPFTDEMVAEVADELATRQSSKSMRGISL